MKDASNVAPSKIAEITYQAGEEGSSEGQVDKYCPADNDGPERLPQMGVDRKPVRIPHTTVVRPKHRRLRTRKQGSQRDIGIKAFEEVVKLFGGLYIGLT